MSTVKLPNEEYEGVLAPEELQTLQQIYDREINSNRNQDTYPFYEGERGALEEKWIAKMEQSLQDRKEDVARRAPLKGVFDAEKKKVNASTQSKVLRMVLAALSEYNKQNRRGHFFDGNEVKTFNPCGTRSCKERAMHIREALTFLSMVPPEVLANMTTFDSFKRGVKSAMGSSTRKKEVDPSEEKFQKPVKQYSSSWYNKKLGYYNTSLGDENMDKLWSKEKIEGTNEEVFKKIKGLNAGKYYWTPDDTDETNLARDGSGKWLENPEHPSPTPSAPSLEKTAEQADAYIANEAVGKPVVEGRYVDEDRTEGKPVVEGRYGDEDRTEGIPVVEGRYADEQYDDSYEASALPKEPDQTVQNPPILNKTNAIDSELAAQGWLKQLDPTSKHTFYFNTRTGESVWTKPKIPKPPTKPSALSSNNFFDNFSRIMTSAREQAKGGTLRKKKRKHHTRRVSK